MMFCRVFIIYYLYLFLQIESVKILGILHLPGLSHYRAGAKLLRLLADNGHDVTVLSPFGEKNPPKNYKDILLDGFYDEAIADKLFSNLDREKSRWYIFTDPFFLHNIMSTRVKHTLDHPKFHQLMNSNEHFDLVIIEEFGSMALKYAAHRFKAPLIVYSGIDLNPFVTSFVGSPENPSYTSHFHLEYGKELTFLERVQNSVYYLMSKFVLHFFMLPYQNEELHRNFPDAPHINEFAYNVSLTFINSDLSLNDALPKVPSLVNIGGFHIEENQTLPNYIQQVLDNAKHGAIYFSLGSNLKSKYIPEGRKRMLIRVFSKLKQTVLWKLEEELDDLPQNIIIRKWFPQNDILAHNNLKLFITHGGIYSLFEAMNHGVPVLAFPIFGDQHANVKRVEAKGFGKWLKFNGLEEVEFQNALSDLLNNTKYSLAAKTCAQIFRDKPLSPAKSVVWWVDYVLRHKGALHLQVASVKLSWYQYLLLDIIIFILIITVVSVLLLKYCLKLVFRKNRKLPIKRD